MTAARAKLSKIMICDYLERLLKSLIFTIQPELSIKAFLLREIIQSPNLIVNISILLKKKKKLLLVNYY
jgi:hypothetical protein